MDDLRFVWLRDKVYSALDIKDPEVFEEFISREDGESEMKLAQFLNQTEEDEDYALIFFKEIKEEEIEIQVELCNIILIFKKKIKLFLLAEEEYMNMLGQETVENVDLKENETDDKQSSSS